MDDRTGESFPCGWLACDCRSSRSLGSRGNRSTLAPTVFRSACRSACVVVVVVEFAVIELTNFNVVEFAVIALAMADADAGASAMATANAGGLCWRL